MDYSKEISQRKTSRSIETTDIVKWLHESGPNDVSELNQLKSALKMTGNRFGVFEKSIGESESTGRRLWRIRGYSTVLVLVSDRARALFRRKLNEREELIAFNSERGIKAPQREPRDKKRATLRPLFRYVTEEEKR